MSLPGRLVLASASYWSVQAVQPVALAIFDKKSAFLPSRTCSKTANYEFAFGRAERKSASIQFSSPETRLARMAGF